MKSLITTLLFVFTATSAFAGTAMKLEGNCNGTLKDGSEVSFSYYSNFDGCKEKSTAAVTFTSNDMGLNTGSRSFIGSKDVYMFDVVENGKKKEKVRISFADSTGNTSGSLRYTDANGKKQSVTVQCEIRDYEYSDCEG